MKMILFKAHTLRCRTFFFSITHLGVYVEDYLQVCAGLDLLHQLRLGPAKLLDGANVPGFLLERQLRFQYHHILRPADSHGLRHDFWSVLIGKVKRPHPA